MDRSVSTSIPLAFVRQFGLLVSYSLVCMFVYRRWLSAWLPASSFAALCTLLFVLFYLVQELRGRSQQLARHRQLIWQDQLPVKALAEQGMQLVGRLCGLTNLCLLGVSLLLYLAFQPATTSIWALVLILWMPVTFALLVGVGVVLGKRVAGKMAVSAHVWLGGLVCVGLPAFAASIGAMEMALGSSDRDAGSYIFRAGVATLGGAAALAGCLWVALVVNHLFLRYLVRQADIRFIARVDGRAAGVIQALFQLMQISYLQALCGYALALPLYLYCVLVFEPQGLVMMTMLALTVPQLLHSARVMQGLEPEYFFVVLKLIIFQALGFIVLWNLLALGLYGFFQGLWLSLATDSVALWPDFYFYFVRLPLTRDFMMAFAEGVAYAGLSCAILVWLYAIFLHREQHRFTWLLVTAGMFAATVYYDNTFTPGEVGQWLPWIVTPDVVLFTALPMLVQFIFAFVTGPDRLFHRCGLCRFKTRRLVRCCPCCGMLLTFGSQQRAALQAATECGSDARRLGVGVGVALMGLSEKAAQNTVKDSPPW